MNTKQLRQKILDLAIKGLLVPQDPNDEPASKLLERIREEKEQLIKDGKLKRNKNESYIFTDDDKLHYEKFADGSVICIEDEIPFEIPETWAWERFGNICNIARGGSPRPIETYLTDNEDGINWIKIGDTEKGGKYICSTKEKIKPEGISKSRYVKSGDFLLTNSMSFGRPYILKTDGCIHDGWLVINDDFKVFDQDFLYYLLSSDIMYQLLALAAKGSTVQNLKSDTVKDVYVAIPPNFEQKRIAKYTEKLLNIVESIELNKLDISAFINQTKSKVLDLAIKGKLVPQNPNDEPADKLLEKIREEKEKLIKEGKLKHDKNETFIFKNSDDNSYYEQINGEIVCIDNDLPFEIPDSWRWCRLRNIGQYKKGPFGSALTKSIFVPKSDNTIKVYEQKNAIKKDASLGSYYITNEYYESKMKSFTVFPGEIIVSCAGTIGETYILPSNIEKGIINQALMRISLTENMNVNYFLNYFDFILKRVAVENSQGTAIKNIPPFDVLKEMYIVLPPIDEQNRIAKKLEYIFTQLDQIQEIFLQ